MGLRRLPLDKLGQAERAGKLFLVDVLRAQVSLLVRHEVAREPFTVVAQEPPREQLVHVVRLEGVRRDEIDDVVAQPRRIAEPFQNPIGDARTLRGVFADVNVRLAEVVQQRGQPNRQRHRRVRDDCEGVLVDRSALALVLRVVADHRSELGDERHENAAIAREPQRLRDARAEQEPRQLAHAVRLEAAADALSGYESNARRFVDHLAQRLVVRREVELRDEAQAADDSQWILCERTRRNGSKHAVVEILLAVEGIDELVVGKPARDRIHRKVAPGEVVLDRCRGIHDDLEVVAPRTGAPLAARRRELDAAAHKLSDLRIARPQAQPHALPGDLEVLDAPVRLELGAELLVIHAENEEVGVLRLEAEQLVADGASDDVRVEAERADVVLDLLLQAKPLRSLRSRRARRKAARRSRRSSAPAASRPRASHTPRSSPGSRRGSRGRRWS